MFVKEAVLSSSFSPHVDLSYCLTWYVQYSLSRHPLVYWRGGVISTQEWLGSIIIFRFVVVAANPTCKLFGMYIRDRFVCVFCAWQHRCLGFVSWGWTTKKSYTFSTTSH